MVPAFQSLMEAVDGVLFVSIDAEHTVYIVRFFRNGITQLEAKILKLETIQPSGVGGAGGLGGGGGTGDDDEEAAAAAGGSTDYWLNSNAYVPGVDDEAMMEVNRPQQ